MFNYTSVAKVCCRLRKGLVKKNEEKFQPWRWHKLQDIYKEKSLMLISLIQDSFIIKATFHENCQLFKHYIFHIIIIYAYKKKIKKVGAKGKIFKRGSKSRMNFLYTKIIFRKKLFKKNNFEKISAALSPVSAVLIIIAY